MYSRVCTKYILIEIILKVYISYINSPGINSQRVYLKNIVYSIYIYIERVMYIYFGFWVHWYEFCSV